MGRRITSFEDLIVWQKAHRLMAAAYQFTELLPRDETYNRIQQLKRAVSSISANIAEGYGRFHYQENVQFCRQARGSLDETRNHILAARNLGQVPTDACANLLLQCDELRMILNGYIRATLERKANDPGM